MRKTIAAIALAVLSASAVAQQVVDQKFDKSNCTSFTGGVGGQTTSFGKCDPVVVKQDTIHIVPGPVQIIEVPVPAPVQKKKVRE